MFRQQQHLPHSNGASGRSTILPSRPKSASSGLWSYHFFKWTTLKSDVKKLETFQLRCLRQILGVSLCDHYRNETVRMKCDNQPLIEKQIQKRRLQWFGRMSRSEKPDHWRVQRAAPKKTWLKNIKEDLKNQWMNLNIAKNIATDRKNGRTF